MRSPTTAMVAQVIIDETSKWQQPKNPKEAFKLYHELAERIVRYFEIFQLEYDRETILPGLPGGKPLS